jgi:hypothetical protein
MLRASVLVKSGLEIEITAVGDPPHWPCDNPLAAKVGTNFADKRRSLVGIVRSRTKATELVDSHQTHLRHGNET